MPSVDSSFWGVRREGKFTDLIITVTKVINFHRLGSFTGGGTFVITHILPPLEDFKI